MRSPVSPDRRQFLLGSSAATLAALAVTSAAAGQLKLRPPEESPVNATIPNDTWLKFTRAGKVKTFRGNTVICHLPSQSKFRDAVTALGAALRSSPFSHKLACTPPESYHTTIFPGANDLDRSFYGWPSDVPKTASIDECTRIVAEHVKAFRMQTDMPIRMKVDGERLIGSIRLVPYDDAENAKVRRLRDRLASDVFHYLDRGHDTYTFHSTLAYQLERLTIAEERQHQSILARHMPAIVEAGQSLELAAPAFCSFENMYRFEPLLFLRS